MLLKNTDNHNRTIYKTTAGKWHNPHRPAVSYTDKTLYAYYQNDMYQNIVGPVNSINRFYIRGIRID